MATSTLLEATSVDSLQNFQHLQQYGSLLPSLEPRASALGSDASFNTSSILARRQQHQIQIIAATFSSVSVLAALCALYWFCMMRRNFRRDLVLLLIIGDFWKSLWFLIGGAVTLSGVQVATETGFCQASGYFLQVGAEACDLSIFLMSLHMSLQIFPPAQSILGHDGLYRIRYWVLAGWFIIPNVVVSLAFINSNSAFAAQGGFCSLPIRPFWYRLALSWIPRYLVWFFVMGVAIRIYLHVGYEFKVFGMEQDQSSTSGIGITNSKGTQSSQAGRVTAAMQWSQSSRSDGADAEKQAQRDENVGPDEDVAIPALPRKASPMFDFKRRQSAPNWPSVFGGKICGRGEDSADLDIRPVSQSNPGSRRGSKQMAGGLPVNTEDFALLPPLAVSQRHGSSASEAASMNSAAPSDMPLPVLSPITEHRSTSVTQEPTLMQEDNAATRAIAQRRRAIQRQLRLLFIYPVVYLLMWIFPFVAHAMNYSNHYAQHPIFAVSVLSVFAQCIMGFVDVCVFCWREKPWSHIPGADGSFWGSFKIWKFGASWEHRRSSAHPASFTQQNDAKVDSTTGFMTSIKRWSMSKSSKSSQTQEDAPRNYSTAPPQTPPPARRIQHLRINSGRSDRRVMDAERAQERLALERAEFSSQRQMKGWQSSRQGSEPSEQGQLSPPSKEWWDRHMSLGDIDDHVDQT